MKLPRRRFLHMAAGAAALHAVSRTASAQAYPTKPIRWIIGFPAGGGADTVARIMEPWLSRQLGQPVIIENRSGASTNIAVQTVVNAPPDGYTLLWHGLSSVVNASLFVNLPFDIQRDIAPVAGIVSYPMIMIAHPSVPAKNAAELIALAKAKPGKVTDERPCQSSVYPSSGALTTVCTAMLVEAPDRFSMMTGCPRRFVSPGSTMRATVSATPPAGKPMIQRSGFDG